MLPLSNLRNTIVALVIGVMIGGFGGFYVKSKFVAAEQVERVTEQRKADVGAIKKMHEKEVVLQGKVKSSKTNIETIKKEIKKSAPYVERKVPEAEVGIVREAGCPERVLTLGAAGMLNAARADQPFDSAAWGNGKGEAPSGVTDQEFIENDLEVVGMYHDLAKRHDALVDWVEETVLKHNGAVLAE